MIEVEREGGVARLFLNRPEKANALNSAMLDALRQSLEKLDAKVDLGVAAKSTQFPMPEVRIGIPSVVEAALLPRLMGSGRAAWLVLTGEAIDARRAFEWGLVEEVCEPAALDQRVSVLAQALLAGDRKALAVQKRLLHLWDEAPLDASVAESIERFASCYPSNWLSSWTGRP